MSGLIVGISGALALSLVLGAAEFAPIAGNATPITQGRPSASSIAGTMGVNRGSKADRVAAPAGSPALTRTISVKLDGFSDTTFLVRIPVATANSPAIRSVIRRPVVACEPVVSVLTEVAKRLQPGRCIT
jgi:hypothetical protein